MSTSVSVTTGGAIKADVTLCDTVDSDGNWFLGAAKTLYPVKAGTALHYLTGFDERTCYRYAAGDSKPPAYFLRALLRGDHGEQWLNATMEGVNAQWWLELDAAREFLSQYRISKR